MSDPAHIKDEEDDAMLASSAGPTPAPDENDSPTKIKTEESESDKKRRKPAPKKATEEVLQRRREGRIKAAATIAQNLKRTGIGRVEDQNAFPLTSIKAVPLINQKNYFADYLKKDEQATLIRIWRTEKLLQAQAKGTVPKSAGSGTSDIKKGGATQDDDEDDDDDDDNDNDEGASEKMRMGDDTIVIHPGSAFMRIGRATDSVPETVPMVVAVPNPNKTALPVVPVRNEDEDGNLTFSDSFESTKVVVTKDFKARMRYYKRRMMPNSRESASNYNKKQSPETISEHNDPAKKHWLSKDDPILKERTYFAGSEALKLPINEEWNDWKLRFPVVNGNFNQLAEDYKSPQEILGDLQRIIVEALKSIEIETKEELANLKCMLIIPDLYDKVYVEEWVNLLFTNIGFGRVGIIQEAVASTFGTGASCACVVDVGAQNTTIACVDEGMIINDSRVKIDFGGDDITRAFVKLMLQQNFPYKDINLADYNDDWKLAEDMKHDFATFNDADIAVQLYNFYKRKPDHETEKYEFKVYDEVMLAPLGLFYPDLFEILPRPRSRQLFPKSTDHYSSEPNDPYSKSHENLVSKVGFSDLTDEQLLIKMVDDKLTFKLTNIYAKPRAPRTLTQEEALIPLTTPLDKAIIESITNAGIATDFNKAKKLYDNLLVVGGGLAKFPAFDILLNDRINIWRPKYLSSSALDDVLNYVGKEKEKMDAKRKQLIIEAKTSKKVGEQSIDEVELTPEEVDAINEQTKFVIDLEKADAISDLGSLVPVNVLPAPKEFDAQEITWKGGSVYGRLKVVHEMWITQHDWELLSTRTLHYKSLFNY